VCLAPSLTAAAVVDTRVVTPSVCSSDLNRPQASRAMPNPVRLDHRFSLGGATFTPVPSNFTSVGAPLKAWTDFRERLQSTATYKMFLARMHQDNPPGTNPAFKPQFVWLVLAQHVAFLPSPAPGTHFSRNACAFGFSYSAVNASSGKPIYGAGG
jgi:hypothetical protein